LDRVCEIRHKSIKNPSNRKRKIDISTDEHIRNYQNWLIVARASRVTHRRSQEINEGVSNEASLIMHNDRINKRTFWPSAASSDFKLFSSSSFFHCFSTISFRSGISLASAAFFLYTADNLGDALQ